MSKFTKFLNDPVSFFQDMKIVKNQSEIKKTAKQNVSKRVGIKIFGLNFSDTDVIVYFYGNLNNYYQLEQWMEPFNRFNEEKKILFVLRDEKVYEKFISEYKYQTVYLRTLNDLNEFYINNDFKIILYVNNGVKNFQSLMYTKAFHIHINHGESEKESMYSNQVKAYDFVFTVGQRGIDRYKEHLLNFNKEQFIKIGRPQLDFINPIQIPNPEEKKVILYAPTWEATHESMNYSSVAIFGEMLIKLLILTKKYIVIYKPHSAIGTKDNRIKKSHQEIILNLEDYQDGYIFANESINNIFPLVDFAFFDNTSVMIDFLYFNKPAAYLKVKEDISLVHILKAFIEINEQNFTNVLSFMEKELKEDNLKEFRNEISEYYLGTYKQGESTQVFIKTLNDLIKKRNDKLKLIRVE